MFKARERCENQVETGSIVEDYSICDNDLKGAECPSPWLKLLFASSEIFVFLEFLLCLDVFYRTPLSVLKSQ